MVWLEVESKVKIENSQVEDIRNKIKEIATFKKREVKVDDYFAIQRKGYPKKAFRFRTTKDSIEVTFKRWLKKYWTREVVVKQEFQFVLPGKKNKKDLLELFEDFGFREWLRKVKRNETYQYNKNPKISIELNNVKGLGYFIEVEYLCQKKEMKKAIRGVTKVLEELEIDFNQIDNTGYTKMLWYAGITGKRGFIDIKHQHKKRGSNKKHSVKK